MPWLWLLKFAGKFWWEIAVVLLFGALWAYVAHINHDRERLTKAVATETMRADQAQADLKEEQANERKARAAADQYENEVAGLRAYAAAHPPSRVSCRVSSPAQSAQGSTASGSGDAATGAGSLPQTVEHETGDIGAGLYSDADEADRILAQARSCRTWALSVSQ